MGNCVYISSDDPDLWSKLEAIQRIDPAISGGIKQVVYERQPHGRERPITRLIGSGYEEIHEVEPGFCVHVTDAVVAQDWRLTASSLGSALRLRLAFAGEADYSARVSRVADESTLCSFIILPPGELLTASFKGGAAYRYCSLSVSEDYLAQALGLTDVELPQVLPMHWSRREIGMGHFAASKASLDQARKLFNIRCSPGWYSLTVRTLSLDLLRMLFDDWRSARTHMRASTRISPAERTRLIRIREQIDDDPTTRLTLANLTGRTKLSRNKLHYGFKQCFGVSIHQYQTERRMHIALRLLQETTLAISDVAERSGYEEPTNFTAAFKKHFAVLPREARQGLSPLAASTSV